MMVSDPPTEEFVKQQSLFFQNIAFMKKQPSSPVLPYLLSTTLPYGATFASVSDLNPRNLRKNIGTYVLTHVYTFQVQHYGRLSLNIALQETLPRYAGAFKGSAYGFQRVNPLGQPSSIFPIISHCKFKYYPKQTQRKSGAQYRRFSAFLIGHQIYTFCKNVKMIVRFSYLYQFSVSSLHVGCGRKVLIVWKILKVEI